MTASPSFARASAPADFPTLRLLAATAISTVVLLIVATMVKVGAELDPATYQAVVLGLAAASVGHALGIFAGAFLATTQRGVGALMTVYLASTVVRFLGTPLLALSLDCALPVKAQPLLIGAATGYLLILVADIATMFRSMQGHASASSPPKA